MLELKNSDRELNKETVIESLKTVSGYLEDLATGRIYKENDEIVRSIQKWGIENRNVGWAMPTDHLQPKQKDFKLLCLCTNRSRSVPSAIDINTLNVDITKSKIVCGHCPPYKTSDVMSHYR
jgi:hypothetical protein